ncbi:invasion protein [Methylobacterium sp. C25]|uniref:invasion associated locus B family protein n=1 Tax=Methylobacterium sp. C25 TaxID=2721622 RepID=UPI001F1B85D6|nr:invasion associated locus B family protein [Methylobacterium sp. C25]MCE4226974.1 invasion protein [Methylobacterium sp. C25]
MFRFATTPRTIAVALALPTTAALLAAGLTWPVDAQPNKPAAQAAPQAAPQPAPRVVPAEPGATTASFGDWVLRCQRGGTPEKPARVCEVGQSMQIQGQTQPIAQIAIGRTGAAEPLQVTVVLPSNVAFPSSVRILAEEKDTPGYELPWRRCLPGACIADTLVKDEALKRWRTTNEPGRIVFKSAAGQDVAIPLSWRGLQQALDALGRELG